MLGATGFQQDNPLDRAWRKPGGWDFGGDRRRLSGADRAAFENGDFDILQGTGMYGQH